MGKILLEDIEIYAFHGVMPEENKTGSRFLINLELELDLGRASQSDDLADTFNYHTAFLIVEEEFNTNSKLLEHVGNRIIRRLFETSGKIQQVKIRVSKMNPPFGGNVKAVSIEMERKRK
jgi:dihydroneopterin aldolase